MLFAFLAIFINIAVPICVGMFVYQDAKSRGMEPILWTALSLLLFPIGLIIYLLVRYNNALHRCPRCDASIKDTYTICPHCGAELKSVCPHCGEYVEADWHLCAHCGTELPYCEPYNNYQTQKSSGFTTQHLKKALIISAAIALALTILLLVFSSTAFFYGTSILHHL